MAQITINQKKGQFGNNPYGNVTALIYTLQADNKGLIVNSGYDKTLQANDKAILLTPTHCLAMIII